MIRNGNKRRFLPVYHSIIWQGPNSFQRRPELWRGTFKHFPTAQWEYTITSEQDVEFWKIKGNMSNSVPSCVQNLSLETSKFQHFSTSYHCVNSRDFHALILGSDNGHALRFQLQISTHMIVMTMRVQNVPVVVWRMSGDVIDSESKMTANLR